MLWLVWLCGVYEGVKHEAWACSTHVGYCAALLDVAAVVFTAAGCVFAFVVAGDRAAGSLDAVDVDVVDLDVGHDAVMLLTILLFGNW